MAHSGLEVARGGKRRSDSEFRPTVSSAASLPVNLTSFARSTDIHTIQCVVYWWCIASVRNIFNLLFFPLKPHYFRNHDKAIISDQRNPSGGSPLSFENCRAGFAPTVKHNMYCTIPISPFVYTQVRMLTDPPAVVRQRRHPSLSKLILCDAMSCHAYTDS